MQQATKLNGEGQFIMWLTLEVRMTKNKAFYSVTLVWL